MGGFTPMFGGGSDGPSRDAAPREETRRPAPSGFTPLFGGGAPSPAPADERAAPAEPSDTRPPGFTPLAQALGLGPKEPSAVPDEPLFDVEAALEEAREEGARQAREELQGELDEMRATVEAIAPVLDQLEGLRADALRQSREDIAVLMMGVCRRVLGDSLAIHPDALTTVVGQAVDALPDDDELRIHVRPDDVERVRDALPDRYDERVEADPRIDAGCRVVGRHAAIDATLAAALDGVQTAVEQWVASVRESS